MRPLLLTFGGTDDRALTEGAGGALPSVRPGWAKGSGSLDSAPQMLPIMDLGWYAEVCESLDPYVLASAWVFAQRARRSGLGVSG
jgi:hypothetical protein